MKRLPLSPKDGTVTAIAAGTADIIATATIKNSSKSDKCAVTVKAKETPVPPTVKLNATKLTMSKKTAKVKKGKSLKLEVTRNSINATEKIKWTTSNKKIATVKNGKVTVKKNAKVGKKVKITATTTNKKKATCKITVAK